MGRLREAQYYHSILQLWSRVAYGILEPNPPSSVEGVARRAFCPQLQSRIGKRTEIRGELGNGVIFFGGGSTRLGGAFETCKMRDGGDE
jgi:hypothetical protein